MNIEKHLKITGNSDVSWKDAIVKAINEASKTIDYLTNVTILEQRARVDGNRIAEYFVDLDLSFTLDLNRKEQNDGDQ
jgi:flavin-binding protein dodecin